MGSHSRKETAINSPFLEVQGLGFTFPDGKRALDGVSFSLQQGETLLLGGKNGSGKSLILRLLMGLFPLQEGSILFRGKEIYQNIKEWRLKAGMVFQDSEAQILEPRVRDELAFGPRNLGWKQKDIQEALFKTLEAFSLHKYADSLTYTLSGGEKRRVALAGIMITDPEFLILDEPFNNLDLRGVREVLEQIVRLQKEGKTLLIVAHELDKVLAHCHKVVLLSEGKILDQGTPDRLWSRFEEAGIRAPLVGPEKISQMTWLKDV